MESSEVRIEEGTLRQTYSGAAWKRAMSKYSVEVEVNGKRYSAWVIHTTVAITATALIRNGRGFTSSWRS